jgi:hypothetical protein
LPSEAAIQGDTSPRQIVLKDASQMANPKVLLDRRRVESHATISITDNDRQRSLAWLLSGSIS